MTKKIITGVIAAVLLVTIAVLAAEKVKEKAFAEKPGPKVCELQGQHEGLLDQLAEAYKANDRQKMGEIINKMQERREKMREFVKLSRWHRWAHRRMMGQMGPGRGQGWQMAGPAWNQGMGMAGPGWHRGWAMQGQGPNQGFPMAGPRWEQFQAMRHGFGGFNNMMGNYGAFAGPQNEAMTGWGCGPGFFNGMGNRGPMAGRFGQMPWQQGNMGMGNWMPRQDGPMQMRGWGHRFQQGWQPEQGEDKIWGPASGICPAMKDRIASRLRNGAGKKIQYHS